MICLKINQNVKNKSTGHRPNNSIFKNFIYSVSHTVLTTTSLQKFESILSDQFDENSIIALIMGTVYNKCLHICNDSHKKTLISLHFYGKLRMTSIFNQLNGVTDLLIREQVHL